MKMSLSYSLKVTLWMKNRRFILSGSLDVHEHRKRFFNLALSLIGETMNQQYLITFRQMKNICTFKTKNPGSKDICMENFTLHPTCSEKNCPFLAKRTMVYKIEGTALYSTNKDIQDVRE